MKDANPKMEPDPQREAALFQAAVQLTGSARASFLDHACSGDATLRARLEALLAAHEQFESAPAEPAPAVKATMRVEFTDAPDEAIGQKIGRYKILEKVGEGGCGVVYVAEQTEPVRRRVALKVIKLGMDTKNVIARFEAERQALAMMDHPNIAKVLDGGSTETGRPYFVMELVRGIRITDYCDQNNLSTRDRLALFMQVCHAIQHAHQKGIIHRDIKPSNILVTLHDGVPVPKVIDFGIAKATEGRLTEHTIYTQLHQFIGTPAYMSPEQAEMSGLDIDTRSDIYSLGVLLYELLTGRTPFDPQELMAQGIDAMRRTIREREPAKPSTRLATLKGEELTTTAKRRSVESSRLARLLRGDLDWIVMKCLEKDRTRRYETTNGLATDLKRHLENEAVTARPASSAYRFQKLVRRNKLAFTAAMAVTLALVLGMIVSAWQAVRATRAQRTAVTAQAQATIEREKAEANEKQAVEAQAGEKVQREKAEALAVENEKNYQTARQNLYAADMAEASRRLKENDFGRTRQLLEGQRPKPGEEDLRGIEWRYLWAASEGNQMAALDTGSPVMAVDVSPDGKLIAAACDDGKFKVWDSATLKLVATFQDKLAIGEDVRFAPAGNVLATCYSTRIILWDMTALNPVKRISFGQFRANNFAFSPDGKFIAVSTDATTLFFDATGEKLPSLPEVHQSFSRAIAFSRDGTSIATGHGSLKIRAVASRRLIRSFDSGEPLAVCFSTDGGTLFTCTSAGGVHLWSVADGADETVLSPQNGFQKLSVSPDGRLLACGGDGGQIELWDWKERQLLRVFYGHKTANIQALAFTPDGGILVSGSSDGTVRLWSTKSAPAPSPASIARVKNLSSGDDLCQFSTDGKWLAVPGQDGIQIVDVEHRRVASLLPTTAVPVGFLSDGHTLVAFGTVTNHIELWNWRSGTGQAIALHNLPPGRVSAFASSEDGTEMALSIFSPDEHLRRLYSVNPRTGECAFPGLVLAPTGLAGLAFSPDGHYLAVGDGLDGTLLCHWPQVINFVILPARSNEQKSFFSKDGTRLMTDYVEGEVRVWEVPSGKLLYVFAGGTGISTGSAGSFSTDGLTLATAAGNSARLWSMRTGRELMSFDNTRSIGFSPDGQDIAQIKSDGTLCLAQLPTLQDIDNPQPETLAQLAEAANSPAGEFGPVMMGSDEMHASTNLTLIGFKDRDKIAAPDWTSYEPDWLKALKKSGFKFTSSQQIDYGTWIVNLNGQPISDLSVLRGAPIMQLRLQHTAVSDLTPLRGMPLQLLEIAGTRVTDLSALQGLPLTELDLSGTRVSDLSPLRGMPLTNLRLAACKGVKNLQPLAEMMSLQSLELPPNAANIEVLRGLTNLTRIGFKYESVLKAPDKTAAEFWKEYDAKQITGNPKP